MPALRHGSVVSVSDSLFLHTDEASRADILKIHAAKVAKSGDIDYEALAKLTDGCNGADLANVVRESGLFAIRADREYVTQDDCVKGARKVADAKSAYPPFRGVFSRRTDSSFPHRARVQARLQDADLGQYRTFYSPNQLFTAQMDPNASIRGIRPPDRDDDLSSVRGHRPDAAGDEADLRSTRGMRPDTAPEAPERRGKAEEGDGDTSAAPRRSASDASEASERPRVVRRGWMTKQGKIRKSWKRRFFVLKTGGGSAASLKYMVSESSSSAKGEIFMSDVRAVCEEEADHEAGENVLSISVVTGEETRVFLCRCENAKVRSEWATALMQHI